MTLSLALSTHRWPPAWLPPIARSKMTRPPRSHLMLPASPVPAAPRQLSIVFETLALQGMSPGQRANAVTQLAILLLQAAGVQTQGASNDEH